VTTLTPEQTRTILDAESVDNIEQFVMYGDGDLSSDFGDNLAYSARDAGWTEIDGPFYVRFLDHDEHEVVRALGDYLAEREERDVPNAGGTAILQQHGLRSKIQQINDLIASLPEDGSVLWLSNDGSWGGAADLSIYRREDLSDDVREGYQIED
jgi:hypothetical protein